MDGHASFLTVYLRGISARSCNGGLGTYLAYFLCHVLASEEEHLLHVSLHELRKRGHIAVKAASVESST